MAAEPVENNPILNISIFLAFVVVTLIIVFRASRNNKTAADYYAAGRSFTGPQNGFAISGDYLSAASFLGICGAIASTGTTASSTRSGSWSRGWSPCCWSRSYAQHRPVHDGRRAVVPAAAAPGAPRGGDHDPRGLLLLPAGADGGSGRPGRPAARHRGPGQRRHRHRRRRRADGALRADRRDEGHHVGADHQGDPARRRCRGHVGLGARDPWVQLLDPAGCVSTFGASQKAADAGVTGEAILAPGLPTARTRSTSCRSLSRSCSEPRACRTC